MHESSSILHRTGEIIRARGKRLGTPSIRFGTEPGCSMVAHREGAELLRGQIHSREAFAGLE
jgi:hypothetical protein